MMAGRSDDKNAHRDKPLSEKVRAGRAEFERQVEVTRAQLDATNERIQQRTGRNLILAIVIGLGFGGLFLVSLIVVKVLFVALAMALAVAAVIELSLAFRHAGYLVPLAPLYLGAAILMPLAYVAQSAGIWLGLSCILLVSWLTRLVQGLIRKSRTSARLLLTDLTASTFIFLYIGLFAALVVAMVSFSDGQWWALGFIIVVIAVDTGAYASGLTLGKHPMAPRVSPKKTWEGLAGAFVASLVAGILVAEFMLGQPWWFGLIFGACITATATFGDLAESLLKRELGIKDMSSWLPGHGGLMDRLDSILPSAAITYVLFFLFV